MAVVFVVVVVPVVTTEVNAVVVVVLVVLIVVVIGPTKYTCLSSFVTFMGIILILSSVIML